MSGVCPELSSHNPLAPFITKDNVNEIVPDTFNRVPGTVVTVSCNKPLVLNGEATFTCKGDLTWSYSFKPFCTSSPMVTEGLDEETKIIIGVVCGIAGLIIAILIIMVITVWYRDRHRRDVKYEYWRDSRRRDSIDYKSGPPTLDMEMFHRVTPPPPYRSDLDRPSIDKKYRRYHGSYVCLTTTGGRRLRGGRMYLPGGSPMYTDYFDEVRKSRYTGKSRYDDDVKKPRYVREWLSRSDSMLDSDYHNGPYVHGRYFDRDGQSWMRY